MTIQEQEPAQPAESGKNEAPVEPAAAEKTAEATQSTPSSSADAPAKAKTIRPSADVLKAAVPKEGASFDPAGAPQITPPPPVEAKTDEADKKPADNKSGERRGGGGGRRGGRNERGGRGDRPGGRRDRDGKRGRDDKRDRGRGVSASPLPVKPLVPVPIKPIFDDYEDDDAFEQELLEEMSDFDAQIEAYLPDSINEISGGDIVDATIVLVKETDVLLDVGDKAECTVPRREFESEGEEIELKPGDVVKVFVKGRSESGQYHVSYARAQRMMGVMKIQDAFRKHQILNGKILKEVKGGLICEVTGGVQAFLPASHLDLRRVDNLEEWVGKDVRVYIIDFSNDRKRIIASRRAVLDEENQLIREAVISKLAIDEIIGATVKSITDFGAFVDLGGGVDGLIPREEISWERGGHPSDYLKVGDPVSVKVLSITRGANKTKISLSRKQAKADPFEILPVKYPEGSEIEGEVVGITHFGAFVRIEEGIQGMIHVSDLSWSGGNKRVKDYLKEGDKVKCTVLEIDQDRRRLSLGIKQLADDPWELIDHQFPVGTRCEGEITSLVQYGAFVKVSDDLEGLVHISDFSWDKKITKPSQMVKKGDKIQCVVLDIDHENRRLSLGIKQLTASPFEEFLALHRVGDKVNGKITKIEAFGAFVEVSTAVEGLLHLSQISEEQIDDPKSVLEVGQEIEVKITKIDRKNQKVSLSRREVMRDLERQEIQSYMKAGETSTGGTVFGELLRAAQIKGSDGEAPEEAPAESAAPAEAPAEEAQAEEAPAAEAAPEEAPKEDAPKEDAPEEEAKADEADAAAEEAPAEEAPAEEAAADEAPAEEAQAEEAMADDAEAPAEEEAKPEGEASAETEEKPAE